MNPNQLKGNIVMMQLIISGLQYQPCNPGFIQARDAIIFADKVHYNGLHRCLLWRGYSKRGLGVNAKAITTIEGGNYHIDGFDIPTDCI